jgi:formylglycine-generating enzyme required for sulfatase activity
MGRNWAITIGINKYHNLQPLGYAVQDAAAMRKFFRDEVKFEQVYFFVEGADPIPTEDRRRPLQSEPTFGNVVNFLDRRFQQPFLGLGDSLWFFFAGHGKRYQGRDYLMLIDSNPGNVSRTVVAIRDLTEQLQQSGASNIILMLDACRDADDRGGLGIGADQQKGVVAFYSCNPEEPSYEIEEIEHGAFTYTLLEGLRIQGAGNCATVKRLDEYLYGRVPALNQQYGRPIQTPYTSIEPLAKSNLILLPQRALPQDAAPLKLEALKAEIARDFVLAEQFWMQVLIVLPGDLDAIAALKRIGRESSESTSVNPSAPTLAFETVTVDARGNITNRQQRSVEYRREELGKGISLDLVAIPAGEFIMGSPEGEEGRDWYKNFNAKLPNVEGPQHQVAVKAFWMGKYLVTQAQWRAVAKLPKIKMDLLPDPSNFKGDNRPVEQVSWEDAIEFCARLTKKMGREYRLPSEAEWEYACRAGTKTPFYFGETITTELANYRGTDWEYEGKTYPGNYGQGPHGSYRQEATEVGSFSANAFGLYDMHGNVWEWCEDDWHNSYEGAPSDGRAWIESDRTNTYRLLRGGSWYNIPRNCRSAYRSLNSRDGRYTYIGFRVCCVPPRLSS